MPKIALRKDFIDGQVLHGNDLNSTNEIVEFSFNSMDDLVQAIAQYVQTILPSAKDYTDEQLSQAALDFILNTEIDEMIDSVGNRVTEVSNKVDQNTSEIEKNALDIIQAAASAGNANKKADETFDAFNLFANETYVNDREVLNLQIDGKIESFFQNEDPNTWSIEERNRHNGDMWYSIDEQKLKRYEASTNTWKNINDKAAIDAYENASIAKSTADGKAQTFITIPIPPYSVGDLWIGGGSGDLRVCKTSRATGNYNAADWELATKYTDDSALNSFLNDDYAELVNNVNGLQSQIDGSIMTWFEAGVPNLNNYPAVEWNTIVEKDKHLGDLYYDTNSKYAYRFMKVGNVYSWDLIKDSDISKALAAANEAKDTADKKRRVFIDTPTVPYDEGDLWSQGTSGDLMVCIKAKTSSQSYSLSDWDKAGKYTDDSSLNDFVGNVFASFKDAVDGLTMLYYSYDDPSLDWETDVKKNLHVGDLWRDRNTNIIYKYSRSESEPYEYSWLTDDVPSSIFDQIDGKKAIYTSKPLSYDVNDIWIIGQGVDDKPSYIKIGDILVASASNIAFSWNDWHKRDGYIQQDVIDSTLEPLNRVLNDVVNDLNLNIPSSKMSQLVQTIASLTANFQIKGGANLIPNSLQLFSSLNTDSFSKTGVWEIRQNQLISANTSSHFMNYCTSPGKLKWTIKVTPNTAYTLSLKYSNVSGEVSTVKLTNGNQLTLINENGAKDFKYYEYGFITNSNSIIIEIETAGKNFGYSDLILNYGAIINENSVLPNALKWQPAQGETYGNTVKSSYDGQEIIMKNGTIRLIQDNTGFRLVDVSGNIITYWDETGTVTPSVIASKKVAIGIFTIESIDTENVIEY